MILTLHLLLRYCSAMNTESPTHISSDKIVIGIMVLVLVIIVGGLGIYLRSEPANTKLQSKIDTQQATIDSLTAQNSSLQQRNNLLQSRIDRLERGILPTPTPYYPVYPTPTVFSPIKNHQYDSGGSLRITGIYELTDSVIYTTNTPAYSTFLTWIKPGQKTESYMVRGSRFNSRDRTQLTQGFGYQIEVYHSDKNVFTSTEYFFMGNRTVLADARCPSSYSAAGQPVCTPGNSCIKDSSFISEYCPLINSSRVTY